jgi:WD40 repeat protein
MSQANANEQGQEEQGGYPKELELLGVIGFNGTVRSGLILHPGNQHVVYPLGSTIVVRHLETNTQTFLQRDGHDQEVSCLALSSTGKYLASGQSSHMGFPAAIIIWDLETYEIVHKMVLHKGKVQDLCFSPEETYLASLGGRDDNKLIVWDVKSGEAVCGAPASTETALCVRFMNNDDYRLVTGGNYHIRVWDFDLANRKVRPSDCKLGQLKRVVTDITVTADDSAMVCTTKTGDALLIGLNYNLFKTSGPKKPFQRGLLCITQTKRGNYLVGAGDGTVACLSKDNFRVLRRTKVDGGVTSIALNAKGDHFFLGTDTSNIYCVALDTFEFEVRNTCHSSGINDVAFPSGFSGLFATCGNQEIRIWSGVSRTELLRIQVPGLNCRCVTFTADGSSIVSGWSDGRIRAFKPRSGKLMYCINDAHRGSVTSISASHRGDMLVTGGEGGMVRVWDTAGQTQRMVASMKEHKSSVNSVEISPDDSECVSASADGSCIIWSLERFTRLSCMFASTQFRAVQYHPDQSQILTTGTDRKLSYWDVVDANPIRIIDGSTTDTVTTLSVTTDGSKFICGGGERLVKLWGYDDGYLYAVGTGHSGSIKKAQISTDSQVIVTVGEEGAIFIWRMPYIPEIDDELQREAEEAQAQAQAVQQAKAEARAEAKAAERAARGPQGDGVMDMTTGKVTNTRGGRRGDAKRNTRRVASHTRSFR